MNQKVLIKKYNEVYIEVNCSQAIGLELADQFTFLIPNARFHPKVKQGIWDGKIRLFNTRTHTVYYGLIGKVLQYCNKRGVDVEVDPEIYEGFAPNTPEDAGYHLADKYNLPDDIVPYDYQNEVVSLAIRHRRGVYICPTSSGKSLIIYLLARHFADIGNKVLIITSTTNLKSQLKGDFIDYNRGDDLPYDLEVVNWQAISRKPAEFFTQFDCIFGDEVHHFQANSLKNIMENAVNAKIRIGLTGSLSDSAVDHLILEGLFGPITKMVETHELIERNIVSQLQINCAILDYPADDRRLLARFKKGKPASYAEEIRFIVDHKHRNMYIKDLALSLEGNVLILTSSVDRHMETLYQLFGGEQNPKLFKLNRDTSNEEMDRFRLLCERENGIIAIGSYKKVSTGMNIKNLHHLILGTPTKSTIRILQSIGRVLRKAPGKDLAMVWDLVDDIKWKSRKNYALKHFASGRMDVYSESKFEVAMLNVKIGDHK